MKILKTSTPLVLKPTADVTRSSKQRYQWPHEKDLCPPKLFLEKLKKNKFGRNFPEWNRNLIKFKESDNLQNWDRFNNLGLASVVVCIFYCTEFREPSTVYFSIVQNL